jgi:hypothetical protein
LLDQVLVSVGGLTILTLLAYYISWSKKQDQQSIAPPASHVPRDIDRVTSDGLRASDLGEVLKPTPSAAETKPLVRSGA